MERKDLAVPVEKLRRVFKPEDLGFQDTSEVPPVRGFIGQPRVEAALRLGLGIHSTEHHIYVVSSTSVSRKSVLIDTLNKDAEEKAVRDGVSLRDLCYLANFEKPDEPRILVFPRGGGKKFKAEIENLLTQLCQELIAVFEDADYQANKKRIIAETKDKQEEMNTVWSGQIREAGFFMGERLGVPYIKPLSRRDDQANMPMDAEEKESLPESERKKLDKIEKKLMKDGLTIAQKMYGLTKKANAEIEEMEEKLISQLIDFLLTPLLEEYADYQKALQHFHYLKEYILSNIACFKPPENNRNNNQESSGDFYSGLSLFKVNLFVDNCNAEKMPVIFESNPTFDNLFGKIEGKHVQGAYYTNYTYIKPGSLALADGGYLVLNARDVLANTRPGVWQKLKNTIKYGKLKIEGQMHFFGFDAANLNPEPIEDIKVKVVLVGDGEIYQVLSQYDPEFLEIFKVKAETDSEMPLTPENANAYAGFMALCCEKEGLRSFNSSAVAKIIEYGLRLAGHQEKLSTKFNEIKKILIEANFWAGEAGAGKVEAEHVKKALDEQRLRANLIESKLQELVKKEVLMIDTEGRKVGQINGLAVYDLGDYHFGMPKRITAETFMGTKGPVSIDREVKMSGPIHDKGFGIFSGYFSAKYGRDKLINFSASINFEQSYSGIEGDSASAAELACLISSLAELPIDQSIAITGSVNQKGEIQPIGGVNEKAEGFFDVCKKRSLTGGQRVIIPHQNVRELMLREDIVEACREGKFSVRAIRTVDEALELLMGVPAADIHKKVSDQLTKMTKALKSADDKKVPWWKRFFTK